MAQAAANPGLAVRLIGKANGVGLTRDLELLRQALCACGCHVDVHAVSRADRRRRRSIMVRLDARMRRTLGRGPRPGSGYDLNIMLEHMWPQFLHQARCNVAVPNPEWFDRRDLRLLWGADRIWAKTHHAQEVFRRHGCNTEFIGFDSEDRYDPAVTREPLFFHLAGSSPLKGTARLLQLWSDHPYWPQLIVVQNPDKAPAMPRAANIDYQAGHLDDAGLRQLQNRCRFHLCLSEAEGWGHYIAEGLSVGAVVLSVDAPPMNELVTPERGVLVAAPRGPVFNQSHITRFEPAALAAAVERLLVMPVAQVQALGTAARSWYLHNRDGFHGRVRAAIDTVRDTA